MVLKAVLFDFNGVIIKDELIHQRLLDKLLIEENLCPKPGEYHQLCLGRSDRLCLSALLHSRGRAISDSYLDDLIARKAKFYLRELESLERLPLYPGLNDLIFNLRSIPVKLAVVSGALRSEVEWVLHRANLAPYFSLIVAGDDIKTSKPEPDGYLLAVERLNHQYGGLNVQPADCLAIEDTFAGIQAARSAGIPVVGVANTYPFHMLQRQCNWVVDYLNDLEVDRVQNTYR